MGKRKSIKEKQRSTKHTHTTKDRVTRILKTGGGGGVNSGAPQVEATTKSILFLGPDRWSNPRSSSFLTIKTQ